MPNKPSSAVLCHILLFAQDLDERNVKEFYEAWMSYEYKESSDNLKASALEQRSRYIITKAVLILKPIIYK